MSEPRNIVLYVVLSVVTCGLWAIVWVFQLGGDIQRLRGDGKPNVLVDVLLTIVTCGLWGFFAAYQWTVLIQQPMRERGQHVDANLPVICLVASFFGLQLVTLILMQSVVNQGLAWRDGAA